MFGLPRPSLDSCCLVLCAGLSFSCAGVLGIEETTLEEDSGVVVPEQWKCLGALPPLPTAPSEITITVTVNDFLTQVPVSDLDFKVCPSRTDPSCTIPSGSFKSDATGTATIDLPIQSNQPGFEGYIEVTGEVQLQTGPELIVPYLWYFSRPLAQDRSFPLATFSQTGFGVVLGALGGLAADPDRGHLSVQVTDCSDVPAAGIQLSATSADALATPFYTSQGIPTKEAPATDPDGLGGFLNLRAETTTVEATVGEINRVSAKKTLLIRDGWLTTLRLSPNE